MVDDDNSKEMSDSFEMFGIVLDCHDTFNLLDIGVEQST